MTYKYIYSKLIFEFKTLYFMETITPYFLTVSIIIISLFISISYWISLKLRGSVFHDKTSDHLTLGTLLYSIFSLIGWFYDFYIVASVSNLLYRGDAFSESEILFSMIFLIMRMYTLFYYLGFKETNREK